MKSRKGLIFPGKCKVACNLTGKIKPEPERRGFPG
jgi:hypothetical protein